MPPSFQKRQHKMRVSLHRPPSPSKTATLHKPQQTKRKTHNDECYEDNTIRPPSPKRKTEVLTVENDDEFDEGDPNATSILAFIGANEKSTSESEDLTLQLLRTKITTVQPSNTKPPTTTKLTSAASTISTTDQNSKPTTKHITTTTIDGAKSKQPTTSLPQKHQQQKQVLPPPLPPTTPALSLKTTSKRTTMSPPPLPISSKATSSSPPFPISSKTTSPSPPLPVSSKTTSPSPPLPISSKSTSPSSTPLPMSSKTTQSSSSPLPFSSKTTQSTPSFESKKLDVAPLPPPLTTKMQSELVANDVVQQPVLERTLYIAPQSVPQTTSVSQIEPQSAPPLPQLLSSYFPSIFPRQHVTFASAIIAFDEYLVQSKQIAAHETKSVHNKTNNDSFVDAPMQNKVTCISLDLVLLVDSRDEAGPKHTFKQPRFDFEQWLESHVVHEMPNNSLQLRNAIDDVLSGDAVLLAFYTWLRNLSKDVTRVSFVISEQTSDEVVYYLIKRGAKRTNRDADTPFLWKDNPYELSTMWRHERDRRIVVPHWDSRGRVKVCKPSSPRDGWLSTNATTAAPPVILVGNKQRRMANWFTQQGVNIVDFAHVFERAAQVLLESFSPNGHKTEHKFSFEVAHRLARLLRHRMQDNKESFSRARTNDTSMTLIRTPNPLVSFWNMLQTTSANKRCKAFVLVGVDSLLDADGITKLQCDDGAKVIAWKTIPRDCAVDIDFIIHQECDLQTIFRTHFQS